MRELAVGVAVQATFTLAFTAFSMAMTVIRLIGDGIMRRFGNKASLSFGALIAASGLALAVTASGPAVGVAGFALLGAGCALGSPILIAVVTRLPDIAPAAALSSYATFTFFGLMAGPPLIGFIAKRWGLDVGLATVALTLVCSAVVARKLAV